MTAKNMIMAAGDTAGSGVSSSGQLYVDDVFSTYLYTGNGSTQTITNGIDLAGEGGMTWIKNRTTSASSHNAVFDTNRLISGIATRNLNTDETVGNTTLTGSSIQFLNTGWKFDGTSNTNTSTNLSGNAFVTWSFRKAPKFFDIQTITHTNGTANNIDLSVLGTVGMVIAKITTTTGNWTVWQRSLTAGNNLVLNTTAAQSTTNAWLSVSGTTATLSASAPTGTYVIYAYAHDTSSTGIIQCGSFTTSATLGVQTTVTLGWEPQYILLKSTQDENWIVLDSMRGMTVGNIDAVLNPNLNSAEDATSYDYVTPTATGFYVKAGTGVSTNATYIYMAIRRPNKPPTTGTQVYNAIARTGTGATAKVTGVGFAPDLVIPTSRTVGWQRGWYERLRGANISLATNSTGAELTTADSITEFGQDGATYGTETSVNASTYTFANWFFKRAPGFFDVVCYTGTGVARTVAHNLGVVPELIIIKNRGAAANFWAVYNASAGVDNYLVLNTTAAKAQDTAVWNNTAPSSLVFNLGNNWTQTNASANTYVAYLFATLAGISKVGSYTGNGTTQTINCGFSAGARFLLIKRTDSTGDWFVWDTARGIVAANDPHLSLNTTAAEVTDDSVDPYAAGFAVNQVAATNINVTGGTYIFLAIA